HNPRHYLRVGVHVGRGDVDRITDQIVNPAHEFAREPLQLARRELGRIDVDAALGATEWNSDHRGFPRHKGRQRAALVDVHFMVKAQSTLERPARVVVLHTIAGERAYATIVHLDVALDAHLAVRCGQLLNTFGRETQQGRGLREVAVYIGEGVM